MKLEQRLNTLEDAHRALAARNEALFQICRVILPIAVSSNQTMARRLLTSCYDTINEHMTNSGQDNEYQTMVRAAMDMLSRAILVGCTPPHRPS